MLRKALLTAAVLFSALSTHATTADACVRFVRGSSSNYWVNGCGAHVNVRYCTYSRYSNTCARGVYSGFPLRPGQRIGTHTARGRGVSVRWYSCRGRFKVPTGKPPTRCVDARGARRSTGRNRGGICPPTWRAGRDEYGRTVCFCGGNTYGPTYTWGYYRKGSRCRLNR